MNIMNKLYGISLLSLLLSAAACTDETEEPHKGSGTGTSPDAPRREVMLTLKNKLSVVQTKAGDEIATAAENKISALDIYVFGSKTEDGNYTYQERFCYRENISDIPVGGDITAIDLTAVGSDGKQTTALLSLKKGLFVKLYCIADQSKLINPATNDVFSNFVPLMQSNPGQVDNTVTEGSPTEHDFKLLRSVQLDPSTATDILVTPLPMTGAYTTPLDLTDFSVSARLQLGFRLTRSVARFDIVNDAATSKFTIQSVSMGNGRKGVSFFPLKVTGTLPTAAGGDLITYPARLFDGENANAGTTVSAFYTYPSPKEDGGYLILSGTYATNQTENIPVTYKVPFKPADGGNYIEVSQNHRYTVNITAADEYHLDFTLDVADWTDEGNIDDYEPGGETDGEGLTVTVTGGITYDEISRMVTMPIVDGTQFTIKGNSVSGYYTRMYYENGDTEHQWLTMTPPADLTKADVVPIVYTISKNASYTDTKFPVAFIRFTDKISAKETVVIVQPFTKPAVLAKSLSDGSTYTDDILTLYQTTVVPQPIATLNVFASGGSQLDFTGWSSPVNWLTVSPAMEQNASSANYVLTLNSSDVTFPNPYPLEGKAFTFTNKANETMTETVTLKLKSDLAVTSTTEGQAEFDNSSSTLRLYNNNSDKVILTVNTIGGSEIVNVPSWLTVTKGDEGKNTTTYTFNIPSSGTTGVNSTFEIRSKADNSIVKTYKVYSISKDVTFSNPTKNSNYTTISNFSSTAPTVDYFPCAGSYVEFTVTSPKGITATDGSWCVSKIMSETTLATGQKRTNLRLQTRYDDSYHGTPTGDCTVTVKDKYSGSTKKSITVKQYRVVYPGNKVPPTLLNGWWVAPVNSANSISYNDMRDRVSRGTACPADWRIPTYSEHQTFAGIPGNPGGNGYDANSYPQLKTAYGYSSGEVHFWNSDNAAIGYGLRFFNGRVAFWTLGSGNYSNLRCVRKQ